MQDKMFNYSLNQFIHVCKLAQYVMRIVYVIESQGSDHKFIFLYKTFTSTFNDTRLNINITSIMN